MALRKALTGTAKWSRGLKAMATSSPEQCEHNVKSLALNVKGQEQSGEEISLLLEDWELARVALGCHTALDRL